MYHAHNREEVQKIKTLGEAIARTCDPNWQKRYSTSHNFMPNTQAGGVRWRRVLGFGMGRGIAQWMESNFPFQCYFLYFVISY